MPLLACGRCSFHRAMLPRSHAAHILVSGLGRRRVLRGAPSMARGIMVNPLVTIIKRLALPEPSTQSFNDAPQHLAVIRERRGNPKPLYILRASRNVFSPRGARHTVWRPPCKAVQHCAAKFSTFRARCHCEATKKHVRNSAPLGASLPWAQSFWQAGGEPTISEQA